MSSDEFRVMSGFYRRIVDLGGSGDVMPEAPDIEIFFGPEGIDAAAEYRRKISPQAILIYLFPGNDPEQENSYYEALPPPLKNLFISVGAKTCFADRVAMAVTLCRHRKVAFSAGSGCDAESVRMIDEAVGGANRNYIFSRDTRHSILTCMLVNLPMMFIRQRLRPEGVPEKPAVICGAGPSLLRSIPVLQRHRKQLFVIAAGHAFRALMSQGIEPDMVAEIDYISGVNWQHGFNADIPLLAAPTAAPEVVKRFRRIVWTECSALETACNEFLRQAVPPLMKLEISRTVTVTALDFAVRTGFRRIALVGNDLSVNAAGKTHADPAATAVPGDAELFPVPGNNGDTVMTSNNFAGIRSAIEKYLAGKKINIYNCTDGGALIRGAQYLPLTEFCAANDVDDNAAGLQWAELPPPERTPLLQAMETAVKQAATAGGASLSATLLLQELTKPAPAPTLLRQLQSMLKSAIERERNPDNKIFVPLRGIIHELADDFMEHRVRRDAPEPPVTEYLRQIHLRYRLLGGFTEDMVCRLEKGNESIVRNKIAEGYGDDWMIMPVCRSLNLEHIAGQNKELVGWLASEESPDEPDFALTPAHAFMPWLALRDESGRATRISYSYESPGRYRRDVEEFFAGKNFDPQRDAIVFIAPGDWRHTAVIAELFQDAQLIVADPFPVLLRKILPCGMLAPNLPRETLIVAAAEAISEWRNVFDRHVRQWRRDGRRVLFFINPLLARFPATERLAGKIVPPSGEYN